MIKKNKEKNTFINISVKIMSITIFLLILSLMLVIDTKVEYNYSNENKLNNYIFFIDVTFIIVILIIAKILLKDEKKGINKIIKGIESKISLIITLQFSILIVFQIIMIKNLYFETTWDVEHIINTVKKFASTATFENNDYYGFFPYFSVYPNNLFLANIFALISKVVILFGEQYIYPTLIVIDCILIDIAGVFLIKTIGNFTDKKIFKIIGMFFFMILIGTSPWLLVPYSDTYSILFPIAILYHYTKKQKKAYDYIIIGLYSYIGFFIKPTVIIILIAIIIVEVCKAISKIKEKFNIKQNIKILSFIILGIILACILKFGISKVTNYKIDKELQFSLFHYLMMGINQETTGTFSHNDVKASLKASSYEERVKLNKQIFLNRLKKMPVTKLCEFYGKKLLLNYNDGTFSWGKEGGFYDNIYQYQIKSDNKIKNFYYNYGTKFYVYNNIMQFVWIFILVFTLIKAIKGEFNEKLSVIFLSLIGLTIFLLIFEARARYLYIYSTYFVLIAILGIESLIYKSRKKE